MIGVLGSSGHVGSLLADMLKAKGTSFASVLARPDSSST